MSNEKFSHYQSQIDAATLSRDRLNITLTDKIDALARQTNTELMSLQDKVSSLRSDLDHIVTHVETLERR